MLRHQPGVVALVAIKSVNHRGKGAHFGIRDRPRRILMAVAASVGESSPPLMKTQIFFVRSRSSTA